MFAECSEFCKNLQHDVIIVAVYVLQALHTACEMSDTERHAHMPMLLDPDDSGRVQPGLALSSRENQWCNIEQPQKSGPADTNQHYHVVHATSRSRVVLSCWLCIGQGTALRAGAHDILTRSARLPGLTYIAPIRKATHWIMNAIGSVRCMHDSTLAPELSHSAHHLNKDRRRNRTCETSRKLD